MIEYSLEKQSPKESIQKDSQKLPIIPMTESWTQSQTENETIQDQNSFHVLNLLTKSSTQTSNLNSKSISKNDSQTQAQVSLFPSISDTELDSIILQILQDKKFSSFVDRVEKRLQQKIVSYD